MFDNYVVAKNTKAGPLVMSLVVGAFVLHVAAFSALLINSWWTINELERPNRRTSVSLGSSAPPKLLGTKKKTIKKKVEKKKKAKVVTQVVEKKEKPPEEPDEPSSSNDDLLENGGSEDGTSTSPFAIPEGTGEGDGEGSGPPPPPKPVKEKMVAPSTLKQQQISGTTQIMPPNNVAVMIARKGKTVVAVAKMCLNTAGGVKNIRILKSTGHASYDAKIKSKMRLWKYRPYKVDGVAVPVCSSVTFIYKPQ